MLKELQFELHEKNHL